MKVNQAVLAHVNGLFKALFPLLAHSPVSSRAKAHNILQFIKQILKDFSAHDKARMYAYGLDRGLMFMNRYGRQQFITQVNYCLRYFSLLFDPE